MSSSPMELVSEAKVISLEFVSELSSLVTVFHLIGSDLNQIPFQEKGVDEKVRQSTSVHVTDLLSVYPSTLL